MEEPEHVSGRQGAWVLLATILGSAMVFIDGSAVNVALPVIQEDLGATINQLQWIIEAYALFLAALLLLGGVLGDRFGRRRMFVAGLLLFTLASGLCAVARTGWELVGWRALQGVGAAMLTPGSLAIISASFPPSARGKAIGTWAAFSGLTAIIGPVLGGWLVDTVGWRAVFVINIPIAAIVLAATVLRVPESRDTEREPGIDVAGAAAVTLGLGALIFALVEGPLRGWNDPLVQYGALMGIVLLGLFVWLQMRVANPMVPLGLFRNRTFAASNAMTFVVYGALGGSLFFVPLLLIQVHGYSATMAGAAFLPIMLLLTLFSRYAGSVADRLGPREPMAMGSLIGGLGYMMLAIPSDGTNYWTSYFPGILTIGIGMTLLVSPLTTAVMGAAPTRYSGLASGINNAVSRAAGLVAVAAFGVLALAVFSDELYEALEAAPIGQDVREDAFERRAELGDLSAGATATPEEAAVVQEGVGSSFLTSFRAVTLTAGAMYWIGAVLSWWGVEPKPKADQS